MSAKDQTLHGSLRRMIALTAVAQHDPSQMAHCPAKRAHRWLFHSRPVAVEASQQDRLQVGSLFLNVRVLASSQLFFESPQLGLSSLPHRLAHYLEVPSRGSSATVSYPNKVERSRLVFESMGKILKVRLEGLAPVILAVYTCGPHHLNRKVSCSQSFDIEVMVQKRGELVLSCPFLLQLPAFVHHRRRSFDFPMRPAVLSSAGKRELSPFPPSVSYRAESGCTSQWRCTQCGLLPNCTASACRSTCHLRDKGYIHAQRPICTCLCQRFEAILAGGFA